MKKISIILFSLLVASCLPKKQETASYISVNTDIRPFVYGKINGKRIKFLFDTGANTCLINKKVVYEYIPNFDPQKLKITQAGLIEHSFEVANYTKANVRLGNVEKEMYCVVMNMRYHAIIGMKFIKDQHVTLFRDKIFLNGIELEGENNVKTK